MKPINLIRRTDLGVIAGAEILFIPTAAGLRVVVVDDTGNDISMTLNLSEMQEAVMTHVEEYLTGELFAYSQIDPLSLPEDFPPSTHIHDSSQIYDFDQHVTATKRTFSSQQALKDGELSIVGNTVNWDADVNGQCVLLETTSSVIINAPTNIVKRNIYLLMLKTNGYTPSWSIAFKWPPNGTPYNLKSGTYVFAFIGWDNGAMVPLSPGYKGAS